MGPAARIIFFVAITDCGSGEHGLLLLVAPTWNGGGGQWRDSCLPGRVDGPTSIDRCLRPLGTRVVGRLSRYGPPRVISNQ